MSSRVIHIICDNLRSLYNVGSIFRTSDAFGVAKIWLCGITGTPEQSGLAKVSLGAEHSVSWEYTSQTWRVAEALKKQGFEIVALEQSTHSTPLDQYRPHFPLALVLGNEVDGVSDSVLRRADAIVDIPMLGSKESLNVSVAAGIALYGLRH
jgi:tRNA G18 (ribose-2'-O)-methylase SpoU